MQFLQIAGQSPIDKECCSNDKCGRGVRVSGQKAMLARDESDIGGRVGEKAWRACCRIKEEG